MLGRNLSPSVFILSAVLRTHPTVRSSLPTKIGVITNRIIIGIRLVPQHEILIPTLSVFSVVCHVQYTLKKKLHVKKKREGTR